MKMPTGVLVDCGAIFLGGLIGWLIGSRIGERTRNFLTTIFGFCATSIGITSIIRVNAMAPVILAVVLGSLIGDVLHLEEKITSFSGAALRKILRGKGTDLDGLLTVIVLFCFSGFGFYGVLLAAMSGEHTTLISKAVLDCFTAMVFAISLGVSVMLVSFPTIVIMLVLFYLGTFAAPMITETMLRDFMACGGILTFVTGLRVAGIKKTPVANMIPALALALPFSWLWSLLPL